MAMDDDETLREHNSRRNDDYYHRFCTNTIWNGYGHGKIEESDDLQVLMMD